MEEESRRAQLCAQLKTTDQSLLFLALLVLSVLLSYCSVRIQRRGLCDTIRGDAGAAAALPPVFPLKLTAGALVVGSLGFFLCLALKSVREAELGDDQAARRSASLNLWASVFVFLAALLRLDDLVTAERGQPSLLADDDLPA